MAQWDDEVEVLVIGAGVVGLACARALAESGREVLVVDAGPGIGTGISSRNSEVIHAGIYYDAGSQKALHCVRGKHLLYEYCAERGVPHKRLTKLIVATSESQHEALRTLQSKAAANGVPDLEWLGAAAASRFEPAVRCTAALLSPSSGIIDSHAYMLALQGDIESHRGQVVLNTRVDRLTALAPAAPAQAPAVIVHTSTVEAGPEAAGSFEPLRVKARLVINSAGLEAVSIARNVEGASSEGLPRAHFAKGHYFSLGRRSPFSRLVYPLPEPGGLGVHVTLDMAGQARFGPDVEWLDGTDPRSFDYTVDPRRSAKFIGEIRKYWPDLRNDDLVPAYTGIRPKISGRGEPAADFQMLGFERHGTRGLIHLLGIESPGLTSSLSIAQSVAELAASDLAIR